MITLIIRDLHAYLLMFILKRCLYLIGKHIMDFGVKCLKLEGILKSKHSAMEECEYDILVVAALRSKTIVTFIQVFNIVFSITMVKYLPQVKNEDPLKFKQESQGVGSKSPKIDMHQLQRDCLRFLEIFPALKSLTRLTHN